MAHSFDTGLASPFRTLIRSGVVSLLSGLVLPTGYLRAVIPFGAVVRSWTDLEGVDKIKVALTGREPAIAVAVGDSASKPVGTTGFQFVDEYELLLYHFNNSFRDFVIGRQAIDAAGLAANTSDPGLDIAMAHAKELVVGQRCGVNHAAMKQIRPEREEELGTFDDLTIWLQTFRITTALTINANRGITQMLTSIGWRTTQEDGEVNLPDAPTKDTTIDAITEGFPS